MDGEKHARVREYLSAIFVNIMWGLSFIGSKSAMNAGLQPFTLAALRFLTAALVLFPAAFALRQVPKIRARDVPGIFLSALLGITVYFYFELNGLKHCSAATASLLVAAVPVLTLISGVIFHKKRPGWISWAGACVSLFGVYLVVASGSEDDSLQGILFMVGAILCWVGYMELSDSVLSRLPCLTVTCWQSLFGVLTLLPLSLTETVDLTGLELSAWLWSCLFLGVICSAVCYILYNFVISRLAPAHTALFLNLNPVAAMLGSAFYLQENITFSQVLGGVIVCASLVMVSLGNRKKAA